MRTIAGFVQVARLLAPDAGRALLLLLLVLGGGLLRVLAGHVEVYAFVLLCAVAYFRTALDCLAGRRPVTHAALAFGVGLWMQRRWALWLAVVIAASTAMTFAAFGVHVLGGGAHERQRDKVDVVLHAEHDILNILRRDRRQVDANARQVDMPPRFDDAAIDDFAHEAKLGLLDNFEIDDTVVERDAVAGLEVFQHVAVVNRNHTLVFGILRAGRGDFNRVAHRERKIFHKIAGAYFRPLRIEKYRDRHRRSLVERFNFLDDLEVAFLIAMRHVDTRDVHTGFGQLPYFIERVRRRSDGADDFCFSVGHTVYSVSLSAIPGL